MTGQRWLFDLTPAQELRHFPHPRNEEERLSNGQRKFRLTGDSTAAWGMRADLEAMAVRCSHKINGAYCEEERRDIAEQVALTVIGRILRNAEKKPEWYISSFRAYVYRETKHWICRDAEDAWGHLSRADAERVEDEYGG